MNGDNFFANTWFKNVAILFPSVRAKLFFNNLTLNNIEKISNEKYKVSCVVEWDITNNEGERLQKESADYIVYNFNNSYKVYSMKNWKLISKQYI